MRSASEAMYDRRDVRVDAGVDPHRPRDGAPLARELGDGLREHLDVELEPERGHVPRLLGAEQVACAADLEIAHRDREAGAELGVVGERRQPRPRLRGQLVRVGVEEVGVRGPVGAADAAADLVELREPERVGALHDERVRLRDVEPRLDDGRRDEDVRVAAQERVHPVLELPLAHLPVRGQHAQLRAQLPDLLPRLLDRLDAVVEVERLPAALVLAGQRLRDQLLVVLADGRPDRTAALGRRLDDRDVAQAGERHVQRPRDRRRREREHVGLEAERLQQLLLRHAEALLLVDDHEPEVLRHDVAREHPVRADEHVDLALRQLGEHLLRLLRRAEA